MNKTRRGNPGPGDTRHPRTFPLQTTEERFVYLLGLPHHNALQVDELALLQDIVTLRARTLERTARRLLEVAATRLKEAERLRNLVFASPGLL